MLSALGSSSQATSGRSSQAVGSQSALHAWFKEWKDQETLRILACTMASPEEIQQMWARLREREQAFDKSVQDTFSSHSVLTANAQSTMAHQSATQAASAEAADSSTPRVWGLSGDDLAACPSCGSNYKNGERHDCLKTLGGRITLLEAALV